MAHPDPVGIEKEFNECLRLIASSVSERSQLVYIQDFLERIKGFELEFESYLLQLLYKLPDFSDPLLISGLNPNHFEKFVAHLISISKSLDDLGKEGIIVERIDSYVQVLALLKKWVGEDYHGEESRHGLIKKSGSTRQESKAEVLIPVIEKVNQGQIGRLRRLQVEVIGESKNGFELRPSFGVIGAEAGAFLEDVELSSGNLLRESRNGKNKTWRGTAYFELSHAWHAGRSANLAMAASWYCEMLKAEEQSEYFQLNPAVCITGDITADGIVSSVDIKSLEAKTAAAFFSWGHVLVVPSEHLTDVTGYVEQLKEKFPNRDLPVVGVNHLRELFYDRRITRYFKTGVITHNMKRAWKRRYSVAATIALIVLLGVIGRLLYGPLDRNPVLVSYEGEMMYIKNKSGQVILEEKVGKSVVNSINNAIKLPKAEYIHFFDIDDDGINEVIENKINSGEHASSSILLVYNLEGDTLWSRDFNLDIRFDLHPYISAADFTITRFQIVDINNDSIFEIAANLRYGTYFTSVFAIIDLMDGSIQSKYISSGTFTDFQVIDLDRDEINEIILAANLKGYQSNGVVVLDSRYIDGNGLLGERYIRSEGEKAIEKAAIIFPQTIVGKNLSKPTDWSEFGFPGRLLLYRSENLVSEVYDFHSGTIDESAILYFEFDRSLNLLSIASSNSYDILGKELFETGEISLNPDGLYLNSIKDSLLYWNGTEFQREPTLNMKYLELVGEDSSIYLNHYFKNLQ